jgi:hypothetical protein
MEELSHYNNLIINGIKMSKSGIAKRAIAASIFIFLLALFSFLTPTTSYTAPVISWGPGKINELVVQGDNKNISISVSVSRNLNDVMFRVVSELKHLGPVRAFEGKPTVLLSLLLHKVK